MENNEFIMCGFYCIAFINFNLDYANLFSPNYYKNNDEIIYNYLKDKYVKSMSGKYKNTCKYLNYVEHLLILLLKVIGCVSISTFASLVCVPVSITSSEVGIKFCAITARIKKYTPIIKKKKKNHDKIVFLGKNKLNTIEVLISKALIDAYISRGEFVSVNNVLAKYNKIKKEIKNPEISVEYTL